MGGEQDLRGVQAEQGRQWLGAAKVFSLFPGSEQEEARPGKLKAPLPPTPLSPASPLQL